MNREIDTDLGAFLRDRRARSRPEDAGLPSSGTRRVAGLRREELARLAGISVAYYTRLEQGRGKNASSEVLRSIARALRLGEDETAHLLNLARQAPRPTRSTRVQPVRPELGRLVEAIDGVAALALDLHNDVLAWNTAGHRLLARHLPADAPTAVTGRPNTTRMLFLDPETRRLYPRWQEEAERAVASMRLVSGQHPDDPLLAELVRELCESSPEFAELWSNHLVATCSTGVKHFDHPDVGPLVLGFEMLHLADDPTCRMELCSAARGTPSETALRRLGAGG